MTEMTANQSPQIDLYMIRHAESETNLDSSIIAGRNTIAELSQRGRFQAAYLGKWLMSENVYPDEIYVSTATRARQTAEICLGAMNCDIVPVVDDRLQEVSQGIWEGRPRAAVYGKTVIAQIVRQGKDFHAPGGESLNMACERMQSFIGDIPHEAAKIVPERQPKIVFAFGHGLSIRALAGSMLGWSFNETRSKETANTSQTLLTFDGTSWTPQYIGRPVGAVPTIAT